MTTVRPELVEGLRQAQPERRGVISYGHINRTRQSITIKPMKTTYILGAILACSVIGTLVGGRGVKTGMLVLTALLSLYGLFRLLG